MLYRIQHLDLPDRPFFVLSKGGTLTADFNSTLFNSQSDLLGSYSYPGTMPLEPNRAIIRNAHYINTSNAQRTLNVMMWLGPVPFMLVKMSFTIENRQINYNLYFDIAILSNLLKTLTLNQLADADNNGLITFESLTDFKAYMKLTALADPGVYPMVFFPWKNDGAYIDAAYVSTTPYSAFTAYGVNQKFVWTNNHIYNVIVATTAGMNPISDPTRFDDITVYPDNKLPVSQIINRWQLDAMGVGDFAEDTNFPIAQTATPCFYLVYVLKRIAQYFKLDLQGEWLRDPDAGRIVIWSNIALNYDVEIPDYTLIMPDILVTDFFKEIRSMFGLLVNVDWTRKLMIIESLKNLVDSGEICDLQALQTISYRETGTQSQAFTIEQTYDDKDAAPTETEKNNPAQLVIGDPVAAIQLTDVQLQSAATKMIVEQSAVDVDLTTPIVTNWRIPWIKMPVQGSPPMDQLSTLATEDRNKFKLRFLYYHGMRPDDGGYLYPYASSDNIDVLNNKISDFTLSLTDDGTAFLSVRDYYNFLMQSKPFEMVFEMTPAQFRQIQANKRIIVRDFNYSAVVALLDQNSVDFINGKEKVVVKLTLYPKIQPDNAAEVLITSTPVTPPPPDNGVVFAKLRLDNPQSHTHEEPLPEYEYDDADFLVDFYADMAMTTPKVVTGLPIRIQVANAYEIDGHVVDSYYNLSANGSTYAALHAVLTFSGEGGSGNSNTYTYTLMPSAHYTVIP